MSEACPFCGLDPFEYVDVGIGYVPVAVTCCPFGVDLYRGGKTAKKILRLRQSFSPRKKARAKRLMEHFFEG